VDFSKLTYFGIPLEQLGFKTAFPVSPELQKIADATFELFSAYRKAGFSENQAMNLLISNIANSRKSDE
jgi:hypothetical protein